jgi:antitoxin (DNA-binding transcriptional repressor) of toxin-antitoxin stability system
MRKSVMVSVNITDLRQNLPAYLDKARKGQRINVTVRGRIIAEISPPRPSSDEVRTARALLKGSVVRYDRPFEPAVEPHEWDVNR